ncbi:mannitol dehydrogenase family protein [Profundibacterium mesophilum]|uniref:Mannitol dehydrogenase n=1 Tax=Profundibacterium mesophilum KAUST100406-0324 TaxID=1037889 RepID=A0A921NX24_9RHOB|nr:mannitol dehydrogenase family protein [Profundibacterium mesophilum]KAF0676329.1 Mannitol dehydrogenase [Profundibacterium mesophilum KAUST100406-0324]
MDELIPLSNESLGRMPGDVRLPRYDRTRLTPGIVHVGLGNFHRAHQAWYLHRLFDEGRDLDWAILGAGIMPGDAAQREKLRAQDWMTTLIELDPETTSAEIVGSMCGFVPVEEGHRPLIEAMADPNIRIVSLTVTEGGYYRDATGGLDTDHPDIRHDAHTPDAPRTVFGAMVAALRIRRDAGRGPFTGLSCDNLQGNGDILRRTVLGIARAVDPELAVWIEAECSFPNSMVDCIVPATGPKELALVEQHGIADRSPVTHETYRQWVIEDDFCAGRPALEHVGATFTRKVAAHEAMKLRILNAGHQLLANIGELRGHDTIAQCMADPEISGFFHKVLNDEIVPHVAPVPERTPGAYVELVSRRFSNPAIVDTPRRVAFDGSSRHPGFVLPSIRDGLAADMSIEGLALAEVLWARMCIGTRLDGTQIAPNDPNWARLQDAAQAARTDPALWAAQEWIYGDLAHESRFIEAFTRRYGDVAERGPDAVLRDYAGAA